MWDEGKCLEMSNTLAKNEQEHKSFRRRLDELEKEAQKQNGVLVTLQRQGESICLYPFHDYCDRSAYRCDHDVLDDFERDFFPLVSRFVFDAVNPLVDVLDSCLISVSEKSVKYARRIL